MGDVVVACCEVELYSLLVGCIGSIGDILSAYETGILKAGRDFFRQML